MPTFQQMDAREWKSCAQLVAEAFYDYEYFSIYIPGDRRRQRFLDALLRCEFRANRSLPAVRFFTAKEDGQLAAVAQLCAPDFKKPDDLSYVRAGWLGVLCRGGVKSVNAWNEMEKVASAPCHALPGRNWYLSLLTVAPRFEGRGVGSAFLRECIIPYVKAQGGETLSLFTNSGINRKFYAKNGFTEFDEKHFTYEDRAIGSWSCLMRF